MSVKVVNSGGGEVKITVETIPSINVTSPEVGVIDINPNYTTGQPGATGAQGPAGAAGQGVPTGGSQFQLLRKVSGTDYDTEWDYADRVTLEVRFDEAVSKGEPLHITSFNNGQNRIAVAKADASDPDKMPAIGLAFADYSQNDNGQATTIGSLDDVNTQVAPHDFQEGDVLYVKAGGGLTNVKPTGTNLIQNVGKVGRRQQNNGEIVVMAIGRSNDVPNIPDGQAWIGNSSGVATPTTLATVATTNSYNDLDDTPTLPAANVDTDLSVSTTSDTVTVISSDGTNATITEATASQAGVMTVNMHDKLDGIAANADVTNGTNVDAAGAIMHSDIAANGFVRRTGAETYDQITPGTGLSVSGSNLIVSDDTTLAAVDDTNNVILKVTGPSGTQDAGVTLAPSARLTIEPVGNTVTFTVDNDLANYDNTTSGFLTSGSISTSDLSDVSSAGTQQGGLLIYSQSASSYIHNTLTSGNNVTITNSNGSIHIAADNTQNTTTLSFVDTGSDILLRNTTGGAGSGTQDIRFNAGSNITLTHDDSSNITIASTASQGVDTSGTPASDQVAVFTDADTIEGDPGFTYNGTTNVLNVDSIEAKSVRVRSQGTSVLTGAGKFDVGSRVTYDINPLASVATGDIHVLNGSSWTAADADVVANAKGLLAVAASTQASKGMVLQGVVRLDDNTGFSSATVGDVLYLSDTGGHAMSTTTSLGSGDVVRVVGYVIDNTNGIIYFDPSRDWIELSA